ncbi:MAG TPA: peroxidase family protein [Chthoniobacterales bacterium]
MKISFPLQRRICLFVIILLALPALTLRAQAAKDPKSPQFPRDFRSIDGSGNNLSHPDWGQAGTPLLRLCPSDYADQISAPSGVERPSPRAISNAVVAQTTPIYNSRGASDFIWQWGQFVDHDLDLTLTRTDEPMDVSVPLGDAFFDPFNTGTQVIGFDRSDFMMVNGVRQQTNVITGFLDASQVYGSDVARATELRALDGTGRLKTAAGDLLPFNLHGFTNSPDNSDTSLFLAGDARANEQVGLSCLHILFMREHNFWADTIHELFPHFSDDQIYLAARAIVGAEIQSITYNEFLPVFLGPKAIAPYRGYRPDVNATISTEFSTACYRVGHTMLGPVLPRLDENDQPIAAGALPLAGAFFNPNEILNNGGIDPVLRGLASERAQEIDTMLVDGVRNFLFGPPGAGGFDLASLNLQRGRDHGLPDYNSVRGTLGLRELNGFNDPALERLAASRLASVYGNINDVDCWIGALAEIHVPGAMVGETIFTVLKDQFERTRDGDRFWYQIYLPQPLAHLIEKQTLSIIIRRNEGISGELQDDAFIAPAGRLKKKPKEKVPLEEIRSVVRRVFLDPQS